MIGKVPPDSQGIFSPEQEKIKKSARGIRLATDLLRQMFKNGQATERGFPCQLDGIGGPM
jgi:hypothetical protein